MGSAEAASEESDSHVLDFAQAGPLVPRMVLGAQLRRLREDRDITRERAGYVIRASGSKISRLELGRTGFKLRDVSDLLTLYGIEDESERSTLMALAAQANEPSWWNAYNDIVPTWAQSYLGLEQAASVIRSFEVQWVPGLLQTRDYIEAVVRLGFPLAPPEEIDRRVELRIRRQQILYRENPTSLWAVLDEAVLHRPIGGAATMQGQLEHLIEACALPNVTIQVIPFAAGGHAAAGGPITLLRLPQHGLPDVVYLEQLDSAVYPDRPDDIERYWHVMNSLVTAAEPPSETPAILHQMLMALSAS